MRIDTYKVFLKGTFLSFIFTILSLISVFEHDAYSVGKNRNKISPLSQVCKDAVDAYQEAIDATQFVPLAPQCPSVPAVSIAPKSAATNETLEWSSHPETNFRTLTCKEIEDQNPKPKLIGQGLYGTVFRVIIDGKVYALKRIGSSNAQVQSEPMRQRERHFQEYFSNNRIGPTFFGSYTCKNGDFLIVTEALEETFFDYLARILKDTKTPRQKAKDLLNRVYAVLDLIHRMNKFRYFHNDLHIGNVMFTESRSDSPAPRIIDFGMTSDILIDKDIDVTIFTSSLMKELMRSVEFDSIFTEICNIKNGKFNERKCKCVNGKTINPLSESCENTIAKSVH